MFKIKPKVFSDRQGEALANSLETPIRDDCIKFFDWIKECVVCKASEQNRDSNFQFSIRRAEKGVHPPHQAPLLL